MTYLLLGNPNSGSGSGAKAINEIEAFFKENNLSYRFFLTEKMGQEAEYINNILNIKKENDHLIILGGDGTISLAINSLAPELAFSYIPAGSGNDFARALGISRTPIEAVKQIIHGQAHEIYLMHYQSEHLNGYALNNIGIGLDAQIVKSTNASNLKKTLNKIGLGSLAYMITTLHVLFTKKAFQASVNHKYFGNAFLMTFSKHPYFGGGIKIAPGADNQNPDIQLVEVDRMHILKILCQIPKVARAAHLKSPNFYHPISREFRVIAHQNQPVQIDGESFEILAEDELLISTEKRTIIF